MNYLAHLFPELENEKIDLDQGDENINDDLYGIELLTQSIERTSKNE